jgi:hypothetical protein
MKTIDINQLNAALKLGAESSKLDDGSEAK